ncbi:MAG: hypothetical protein RMK98_02850 [Bacteroidia bacterium]|nr:hypothetical protein [Bacteroidia bacterium]
MLQPSTAQNYSLYEDSTYHAAQKLYFLAVQSENYLLQAEQSIQSLLRKYGPLPSLQMYLYGITALKARYTRNLSERVAYFRQAVAGMDAQVQRTPYDVEVRFLRGSFYYYLPSFLGKKQEARKDLQTLMRLLTEQPALYRSRYRPEVLRAIRGFLEQTEWFSQEECALLHTLYP